MPPRRSLTRPAFPRAAFYSGLALCVLLAVFFQFSDLDQRVAAHYWNRGILPWPGRDWPVTAWLYRFGAQPANLAGLLGALAFGFSFRGTKHRHWRGPGLFLFLLLALGPGLLVNGILKPVFGRPRPTDVTDLGGLWQFQRALHPGVPGRGVSFPSGHAASAWYFLGLPFLFRGWRRWLAAFFAVAFGALMAFARVSQGAHFVSDTLFSGALLLLLAAGLSPLIHWQPRAAFFKRTSVRWALGLGLLAWLSLSKVVYEDRRFFAGWQNGPGGPTQLAPQMRFLSYQAPTPPSDLALDMDLRSYDVAVNFDQSMEGVILPLKFNARFHGQGLPGAKETLDQARFISPGFNLGPGTFPVRLEQALHGLWLAQGGEADLNLPLSIPVDARLHSDSGALTIGPLPAGRRVLISRLPQGCSPPPGFTPYGSHGWLREGEPPFIALDLDAPIVRFSDR